MIFPWHSTLPHPIFGQAGDVMLGRLVDEYLALTSMEYPWRNLPFFFRAQT